MGKARGQRPARISRRSFVGYVVGGTSLVVAADLTVGASPASAIPIPSVPQVPELYDLNDFLVHCAMPTSNLIAIHVDEQGDAHFALPRMEVGQGITTAIAMLIAEELDLPLERVHVTLAPGPPGAGVEPADRRLQHDHLDVHPGPRRGRGRPQGAARRGGDPARCARHVA